MAAFINRAALEIVPSPFAAPTDTVATPLIPPITALKSGDREVSILIAWLPTWIIFIMPGTDSVRRILHSLSRAACTFSR